MRSPCRFSRLNESGSLRLPSQERYLVLSLQPASRPRSASEHATVRITPSHRSTPARKRGSPSVTRRQRYRVLPSQDGSTRPKRRAGRREAGRPGRAPAERGVPVPPPSRQQREERPIPRLTGHRQLFLLRWIGHSNAKPALGPAPHAAAPACRK